MYTYIYIYIYIYIFCHIIMFCFCSIKLVRLDYWLVRICVCSIKLVRSSCIHIMCPQLRFAGARASPERQFHVA